MAKDDLVKVSCFSFSALFSLKLKGPLCIILVALDVLNAGIGYDASSQVKVVNIVLHELLELPLAEMRRILYGTVSVYTIITGLLGEVHTVWHRKVGKSTSILADICPGLCFSRFRQQTSQQLAKESSPFRAVVHPWSAS